MGNYITKAMLVERFPPSALANLCQGYTDTTTPTVSTAFTDLVNNIIERAESTVDLYLAGRYTVPVTANGFIKDAALTAAEVELYARQASNDMPKRVTARWEQIEKRLEAIQDGSSALPSTVATAAGSSTPPLVYRDDSKLSNMGRY